WKVTHAPSNHEEYIMTRTEPRSEANNQDDTSIRPFTVKFPQSRVGDWRRGVRETRWPEHETVGDSSQGVQLDVVQELAKRWVDGHDWRGGGGRLDAAPQLGAA